ncbi:hypothetical protein ACYFX5_16145 [Bremerella sp. T1]|uniref:hypothetical protein n=1 Tax=Bremerella sp. TYQ1 TaxID=3119568 RepID=UPI001CCC761D|nr:hypothetical protein [Bremerella volcania]UBM34588.1 hypothetical protein LA756_18095 [Bremerella volcania]
MPRCDCRIALLLSVLIAGCGNPAESSQALPALPTILPAEDDIGVTVYDWKHDGLDRPCLIALPNRSPAPVVVRFRQCEIDGEAIGVIFFDSEYEIEVGNILSDQALVFVRPGDIVPFYAQLYHVHFDEKRLQLRDVTQDVPAEFHPNTSTLVISRSEEKMIRERLFNLQSDRWADYERVRVTKIAADGSEASYVGKPYHGSDQGAQGDEVIRPNEIVHRRSNVVSKVARIVPPQTIEDVGNLRGWVEFVQENE